jgi:tetratricopeptide (TPR) repeat protein
VLMAVRTGSAAEAEAAVHQAAIDRYEAARRFPQTELEARVREAWLLCRLKRSDEALALTEDLRPSGDPIFPAGVQDADGGLARTVEYAGYFVRAQAFRERREFDRAAEAYQRAIELWPEAQTARVALMTLLGVQGRRSEAESLASAIEKTPESMDPWRTFGEGDRPLYRAVVARLREMAR